MTPPDGDGFADLLSLAAVDHLLTTTAPRTPSFRLVQDGQPLPSRSYTRSGTVGGRPYQGAADVSRLLAAFEAGATVALQSLHRSWAPLARFCRDLELSLTHPVQANAYLTPAGATALAPHHDTHDVFVLQVHGHKRWRVRQPSMPAPLPRHRSQRQEAAAQALLFEADLSPGDCLYLPRGFVHAATAQEGVSFHITIGVHPVTAYDVLRAAITKTGDDPVFRAQLPAGFAKPQNREALEDAIRTCLADAVDWLSQADVAGLAEDTRQRFWSERLPVLEGQLLQLADLDHLDDASAVRRRPLTICERTGPEVPDTVRLVLGDRALVLPDSLGPALDRLLDGATRPVAEFDDLLDAPSRLVLVRRLVREGVVEIVRP